MTKKSQWFGLLGWLVFLLSGGGFGSGGFDQSGELLRRVAAAGLGAAGVVVWARVDSVVRNDGGVGVVGLAARWVEQYAWGAESVRAAVGVERVVELVVLCLAHGRLGVCRYRGAVVGVGADDRGVRQVATGCCVVVGSISAMGKFCGGVELFGVAAQSSGAWLRPAWIKVADALLRSAQDGSAAARRNQPNPTSSGTRSPLQDAAQATLGPAH